MKEIVEFLHSKNLMFKSLEYFDLKLIKSRKKWQVLLGTDIKSNYHIIFIIEGKSRFLRKDIKEVENLKSKISSYLSHNFKYQAIKITSPLCSKAKSDLKDIKYKIWDIG